MIISYYGAIRAAAGKSGEEVSVAKESTVYQLLRSIANVHGDGFFGEIFEADSGELREDLTVTVNDKAIDHALVLSYTLTMDDKLALFPIFPGGG